MKMGDRRPHWADLVFVVMLLGMVAARLTYYEPLNRSVSTHDTGSFILAGRETIFSHAFFTGIRPPTMNLFYALFGPQAAYSLPALSSPGDFIQFPVMAQPGLERIPFVQTLLSIFAWSVLAWVIYRSLSLPGLKLIGAALVLVFGFSPQMAEWDYVLMSEPVSFSLFILLLALTIEICLRLARLDASQKRGAVLLGLFWALVMILWVFTRDTNAYFLLVFLLLSVALAVFGNSFRDRLPLRTLILCTLLFAGLFWLHNSLLQRSGRWASPLFNNLLAYVFPDEDHLAFFEARGMPLSNEVVALQDAPLSDQRFFEISYFMDWFNQHGTRSYMAFILSHPLWSLETFAAYSQIAFTENRQPFFIPNPEITPDWLAAIGNLLHPRAYTVFLSFGAQFLALAVLSHLSENVTSRSLAGLFALFFLGEVLMLFISILGDASNIIRHSMGAVIPIRLSVWLLPPFILDAFSALIAPVRP